MKFSKILNVILAVAVMVLAIMLIKGKKGAPEPQNPVEGADAAIENIMTRTSIRAYEDKPVEDAKIEEMLKAAMAAPTAGNKQPWRFIVIKDQAMLKAISENFHTMRMAEGAPLAIVVCGDPSASFPGEASAYWVQDASAATENLLLAAHALGLGAVWCGIYPQMERVEQLQEMLGIPEGILPLNVIPIGYPAQDPAPKDKWKPEYIRYETWGSAARTAE
ncbi:MAG: nitroreductase family protein [Clostridium sp.]|nr:nitroreductase family protein [Clostridium sp.]